MSQILYILIFTIPLGWILIGMLGIWIAVRKGKGALRETDLNDWMATLGGPVFLLMVLTNTIVWEKKRK